jgi:hypothetical protein
MSEPYWELLGGGVAGPVSYEGDWFAGTTYAPGQIVRYAGIDYLAVNPSLGQVPPLASPVPAGMVCIYDNVLSADAADPWNNIPIPSGYAHLTIVAYVRGLSAALNDYLALRFNGDVGANYDYQRHYGEAAVVTAAEIFAANNLFVGYVPSGTSLANQYAIVEVDIPNYGNIIGDKIITALNSQKDRVTTGGLIAQQGMGAWRSTAAITSLRAYLLNGSLKAGSRLTIYGRLSQGQAPPVTTLAPGGIGTSFPVSPANGELFTLVDSLTAPTYAWDFRYVASITDAYKWVFVGGSPARSVVEAVQAGTTVGSYGDLATVGPTLTLPRPGLYDVELTALLYQNSINNWTQGYSTVYLNGAAYANEVLLLGSVYPTFIAYLTLGGKARYTVPAAGGVLLAKYQTIRSGAGTGDPSWGYRRLLATPVRLS